MFPHKNHHFFGYPHFPSWKPQQKHHHWLRWFAHMFHGDFNHRFLLTFPRGYVCSHHSAMDILPSSTGIGPLEVPFDDELVEGGPLIFHAELGGPVVKPWKRIADDRGCDSIWFSGLSSHQVIKFSKSVRKSDDWTADVIRKIMITCWIWECLLLDQANQWEFCLVMFRSSPGHTWTRPQVQPAAQWVTVFYSRIQGCFLFKIGQQKRDIEVSWNRATPSHHPFLDGIFHDWPTSYWGTPILGNPHMEASYYFDQRWWRGWSDHFRSLKLSQGISGGVEGVRVTSHASHAVFFFFYLLLEEMYWSCLGRCIEM